MILFKVERNKLYLENDEIIDVNPDIIYEYKLKSDITISKELYYDILHDAILSKAYFYLSRRDYSSKELTDKLRFKFIKHGDVIENVIVKLNCTGYINDFEFAKNYVASKSYGRKKVEYELYLKGITKEVISEVYSLEVKDECAEIRKFLPRLKNKEKDKKIAYLIRRGFSLDDILNEIKK